MRHYTHLSQSEREFIFLQQHQGASSRQIARELGRSHATVLREIQRNSSTLEENRLGDYSPAVAAQSAKVRRENSKHPKLADPSLQRWVIRHLTRGWSPEQIAGRLKRCAPDAAVSYETLYQFIYSPQQRSLRLWEFLRRGHPRRRVHNGRDIHTAKRALIPHRISIEQRPLEANQRQRVGHFESDLLEGTKTSRAVVSVTVDRKSGYVLLDKLLSKQPEPRADHLAQNLGQLPFPVRTVTLDNGIENMHHERITRYLGCGIFFCHPYRAWEKGTVENTIGLIRSYIPKRTDLSMVTLTDLRTIARELNDRPRKRLAFCTPSEVVYNETGWCI
jgi:IS30 family transposase